MERVDVRVAATDGQYLVGMPPGRTDQPIALPRIVRDDRDSCRLERFEEMSPADRLAPPHAIPLSRVNFPFERVRLASLETGKIRKGQSIPARGVASKEGDWGALVGPSDEMVALGQVSPIGTRGIALIRPKLVLAE